jgi:hypothetical protein
MRAASHPQRFWETVSWETTDKYPANLDDAEIPIERQP